MTAYAMDEALDVLLTVDELRALHSTRRGSLPRGASWASEEDYGDPLPDGPVVPGPAAGIGP